jgi:hypothetical protein
VSEAVWAAGRLQHYNAAFFAALRPRFRGLLPGFSDSQLVDVLWGLAKLGLYDTANMDAAAQQVGFQGVVQSGKAGGEGADDVFIKGDIYVCRPMHAGHWTLEDPSGPIHAWSAWPVQHTSEQCQLNTISLRLTFAHPFPMPLSAVAAHQPS